MLQTTIALVIFLFPLAYSPGPGNMFFAANGARFGLRATLPANLGYHLATWIMTAAIGFGFIAVMNGYPRVFTILKTAGSLYVLWIAWRMFRSGTITNLGAAKPAGFLDGVVLLVLNPKAYVIIALMFAQFLEQTAVDRWTAVILITTVFTLNNFLAFIVWTTVGNAIAMQFRTPNSARKLNRVFGVVLAAVAVWMLLS